MFAGSVSCRQGRSGKAQHAADSHDAAGAALRHVRQHLLGEGHGTQEVELHQSLVHIDACVQEQRTLASASVVDQDVNLEDEWDKASFTCLRI